MPDPLLDIQLRFLVFKKMVDPDHFFNVNHKANAGARFIQLARIYNSLKDSLRE